MYTNDIYTQMQNLENFGGAGMEINNATGDYEVAQVDIKVQRGSATIAEDLPFALFGRQFLASGYSPLIQVPSGLTLSVLTGMTTPTPADYGRVTFRYTDGVNTDNIYVTASAGAPYPALIEATMSDIFKINKMRIGLSDPTQQSQYSAGLEIVSKSLFGRAASNEISVTAFKSPGQFQDGIVDVNISTSIDKETAIVGNFIQVANLIVTFSVFISRLKKLNRKLI